MNVDQAKVTQKYDSKWLIQFVKRLSEAKERVEDEDTKDMQVKIQP